MTDSFDQKLATLAIHLADIAKQDAMDVQDKVKIFKELREYYAILTEGNPKGDKDQGRRPTMQSMRDKIALVSHGENDGRATPSVQDRGN